MIKSGKEIATEYTENGRTYGGDIARAIDSQLVGILSIIKPIADAYDDGIRPLRLNTMSELLAVKKLFAELENQLEAK